MSPIKAPTPPTMKAQKGSSKMAAVQIIRSFKYMWPPGTGMLKMLMLIIIFMAIKTAVRASFFALRRDLLISGTSLTYWENSL